MESDKKFRVIKRKEDPSAARRRAKKERLVFEEILIRHLDAMYTAAVGLTKDRDRAQDLIQDACLRAFKGFHTLTRHENLKGWLFKVLMNTFIDQYRKHVKEPPIVDLQLSENLLGPSSYFMRYKNPSPEEIFFAGLQDEDVREALNTLHVDFRTVV